MKEIQARLKEIASTEISKTVYKLSKNGNINKEGADKTTVYFIDSKKSK